MNPKFEECAEWLRKAKNDVLSARILLSHSNPVTDTACFHCQQAVEKSLKAFLISEASIEPLAMKIVY
jgi:HEPN domain-containing protein